MAKPQLLFLPGLACDAEVWAHQVRHFATITTTCAADYGTSDSIEKMARAALRGMPEEFTVAGHSMGGRVAYEIYRSAPGRVKGLALLDTAYRPRAEGGAGEREHSERMALVEIAQWQGMRAMGRSWMPKIIHPDRLTDTALTGSILEMFGRKTPEIYRTQVCALLNRPDATPVLGTIRCPTLALCGREDTWSPVAQHEEIASRIAGSELKIIERCGHMAPMERPEEVTAALAAWFARL
ncbi:MAG: alpha/beta fold hydrolase [Candidatus Acidiferrales bacterium]